MEVIILAHEKDIGDGEEEAGSDQVCPMCRYGVGAKVDESQRDGQLLVCVLAVGLAEMHVNRTFMVLFLYIISPRLLTSTTFYHIPVYQYTYMLVNGVNRHIKICRDLLDLTSFMMANILHRHLLAFI